MLLIPFIVIAQPRARKHTIIQSNGAKKIKANVDPGESNKVSISSNGVPFDPGAAEWFEGNRNSSWQYEALFGAVALGVDENHAHVRPTGAYHYHGLPKKLLEKLGIKKGVKSPIVGYVADGFPILTIYGDGGKEMTSSYRLKSGTRTIGGRYDGTFVADYTFEKGPGTLDECNGIKIKNGYAYFLTRSFPVIPRCWRGTPNKSFRRGRGNSSQHSHFKKRDNRRINHSHRHGPPQEAVEACSGKSENESCSFSTPRGLLRGACFQPPRGELACRP